MHQAIKRAYEDVTGAGQVNNLASRLGLPRWKVSRYAIQQGWIAKQRKEPNWSKRELGILEKNAHFTPETIQRKLEKSGFKRSVAGIVLKRKRSKYLKNLDGRSATSLAFCFGVEIHFILKAINQGRLKAEHRHTKRTEKQGGDIYFIKDKDIKGYIRENVHGIDFRKVDKYWLVSVLTD